MRLGLLVFFIAFVHSFTAQLNIDSLSHINYQALHGAYLNDVWGYVDEQNNEYAIVGTSMGTSIVDVTDPANPQEVFWISGSNSNWRDPCVYGDYAYVTTEENDGFLIIDLSPLPTSTVLPTVYYSGTAIAPWHSAHTCFVDENGFAYVFGADRGEGGVIILDVHTDPMAPIEVGEFQNWYVHDGFVRNDTMYLAHISDGFVSLVDVSDKANPVLVGTRATPNEFSHNVWPASNGEYMFTTDEVSGAFIAAYDISDPSNIFEVDRIQNSPGQGVIPHNTHWKDEFLITSYYSDGIVVHDVTYPYNIIKVGEYDTYPTQTPDFNGCWGVYPFLPSGTILASDITEGLFILGPVYEKASYLEGVVTDASTLNPIDGVSVQIITNEQIDITGSSGNYATGILGVGNYSIVYSKVGYFPQTINVSLSQGIITYQDVQLVPIPPYNLTVNVVDAGTGLPLSGVQVLLKASLIEHLGVTNGLGQEDFILFYQENYTVNAGKWGYQSVCYDQVIDENTLTFTVQLSKGYYDDFTFDYGWTIAGTATTGIWERGEPNPTVNGSAPGVDVGYDCSDKAYVTGNSTATHPDTDDVDGGVTLLISPTLDLTGYSDPHLNFFRWFYCYYGAPPDDSLKIVVSNGFDIVQIAGFGPNIPEFSQWLPNSIRLSDYLTITNSMQFFFRVSDLSPDVNVTEAAIDYFSITNSSVLEEEQLDTENFIIYPNPVKNEIIISGIIEPADFFLMDMQGKAIFRGVVVSGKNQVSIGHLPSGMYLLKVGNEVRKVMKE
jgi:choice-of-anchor B domain-containing protein